AGRPRSPSSPRATAVTRTPSATSAWTVALPTPELAPVTTASFPRSDVIRSTLLTGRRSGGVKRCCQPAWLANSSKECRIARGLRRFASTWGFIQPGRGRSKMKRLEDKVAIVTGATSGIGRSCAVRFAQEGAHVVVAGRRREAGEAVAASLGGGSLFVQADELRGGRPSARRDDPSATHFRLVRPGSGQNGSGVVAETDLRRRYRGISRYSDAEPAVASICS